MALCIVAYSPLPGRSKIESKKYVGTTTLFNTIKTRMLLIGVTWGRKSNVARPRGEENQRNRGRREEKVVQLCTPLLTSSLSFLKFDA